ncbi:MAG: hypothetical protein WA814_05985, partial [Candidatus Baltobacteraceae bacterium]
FAAGVQAARDATKQRPGYWADLESEAAAEDGLDISELKSTQRDFGAMPLIILSAPLDTANFKQYGANDAEIQALGNRRNELRDGIVALSRRGVNCTVSDTGHFIQLDRPQVVIHAITQAIELTQTNSLPSCASL